jgi:hypothetical protein
VTIQAGNASEAVPPRADVYILSHVIHDWNEEHCLTILRNCRAAMTPTSRLLIIELVLREGNAPRLWQRGHGDDDVDWSRGRTARQFESLLARAGPTNDAGGSDDHQREHRRGAAGLAQPCRRVSPRTRRRDFRSAPSFRKPLDPWAGIAAHSGVCPDHVDVSTTREELHRRQPVAAILATGCRRRLSASDHLLTRRVRGPPGCIDPRPPAAGSDPSRASEPPPPPP